MLIDITIKNYLSFKEETTFSLLTWTNKKNEELSENFFDINKKIRLVKTAVIYWPNASGKTNLLKAINLVKNLIVDSWRFWPNAPILGFPNSPLEPFRLNDITRNQPSEFEVNFEIEWLVYRYKFSLTNKEVLTEELFCYKTQKESLLFSRKGQEIVIKDFEDNNSKNRVNENNLALSIFAKEWSQEAKKIHSFFMNIYVFFKQTTPIDTSKMMEDEEQTFKPFLLSLLKNADLGIEDLNYKNNKISFDKIPDSENLRKTLIAQWLPVPQEVNSTDRSYFHSVYNNKGDIVGKDAFKQENESMGTIKMFERAGSIYNVIRQWKILFIDEIDDSLHPLLIEKLVQSFHNAKTDKPYQLIFTTHDTHLMDIQNLFRRDQIWFVNKSSYGDSKLYGLLEFKDKTRKDLVLEKNYYKGRYGALPNFIWDNLFFDQENSDATV